MTRRPLTSAERVALSKSIRAIEPIRECADNFAWVGLGFFFVGGFCYVTAVLTFKVLAPLGFTLSIESAKLFGLFGGTLGFSRALYDAAHRYRKRRFLKDQLTSDLTTNVVEEEQTQLKSVIRLQEEEHFTEFLLLFTTDQRVRSLLDDSTTNIEGDRPKPSNIRLAQDICITRYPTSGYQHTTFSGTAVRRPKAILSDPRDWPADDVWLEASEVARLTSKLGLNIQT